MSASQHEIFYLITGPETPSQLLPRSSDPQVPRGRSSTTWCQVQQRTSQALSECWVEKTGGRRGQTLCLLGTLGMPKVAHTNPLPPLARTASSHRPRLFSSVPGQIRTRRTPRTAPQAHPAPLYPEQRQYSPAPPHAPAPPLSEQQQRLLRSAQAPPAAAGVCP